MKKNLIVLLIILLSFIIKQYCEIYLLFDLAVKSKLDAAIGNNLLSYLLMLLLTFIPLFIAYLVLNKVVPAPVNKVVLNNKRHIVFILCSLLPLVVYGMIVGNFNLFQLRLDVLGVVLDPLYLFLVVIWFLFYQLYGRTNLGFISVIVGVLLIYLGADFLGLQRTNEWTINDFVKMIVSFVVLSWLLLEWKYNLIVPIAITIGLYLIPYVFHFAEISYEIQPIYILFYSWMIALTVFFKLYKKEQFEVRLATILMRKEK
jgi:hypothetical protein